MSLHAGGLDDEHQLGINPPPKIRKDDRWYAKAKRVPFDLEGIQSLSSGVGHTVMIKGGEVYVTGNDEEFQIGSNKRKVYKKITKIKICDEPISWVACSNFTTMYLTSSGKVIYCHPWAKGEKIIVPIDKKAISITACCEHEMIIDEEGALYVIDRENIRGKPTKYTFESPVIDAVIYKRISNVLTYVLTADGRVIIKGKPYSESQEFVEAPELKGMKIEKISMWYESIAVLTSDGRVFISGENDYGELGNGTTNKDYSFTEIKLNEPIKDVSSSKHTLFLTNSNKIYGCGWNYSCQLFKNTNEEDILSPILIATMEADQVFACWRHTFILSGTGKLENPAKRFFSGSKATAA